MKTFLQAAFVVCALIWFSSLCGVMLIGNQGATTPWREVVALFAIAGVSGLGIRIIGGKLGL